MGPNGFASKRLGAAVVAAALLAAAALGWAQRGTLLAWYQVRGLARAAEADQAMWVNRVAALDGAAVPGLLGYLGRDDRRAAANAAAGINGLARRWGPDDARTHELAHRLSDGFPRFSPAGQQTVLALLAGWVDGGGPLAATVTRATVRLLAEAAHVADDGVHAAALRLATVTLTPEAGAELRGPCRQLLVATFHDAESANRAAAVQLAGRPGMDLLKEIVALLDDQAPEVRRQVMLVIGCQTRSSDYLATEDLLRSLHDPDPGVKRLCEEALAARELQPEDIEMGRLITDASPAERLRVLHFLQPGSNRDTGLWLRHLTHDTAPAVRSAAVRATALHEAVTLRDRLDQMAHADPSPTVRQLAAHYLAQMELSQIRISR